MSNKVFFSDITNEDNLNLMLQKTGILDNLEKDDNIAIKIDFDDFINSESKSYAKEIINYFNKKNLNAFITDTNKMYNNKILSSICYLNNFVNSYNDSSLPITLSDGINGRDEKVFHEDDENKFISSDVYNSDALIVVSFVRITKRLGLTASISNLSDCSSINGKIGYYKKLPPFVSKIKCLSCKVCANECPEDAIEIKGHASINKDLCTGCNYCINLCPTKTIKVNLNDSLFVEETCKYCNTILNTKKYNKVLYINILTDIQYKENNNYDNTSIVDNIGFLASYDAVAIDKASFDLINNQKTNIKSALTSNFEAGEDKIKGIFTNMDSLLIFNTAEELKVGSKDYELIKV